MKSRRSDKAKQQNPQTNAAARAKILEALNNQSFIARTIPGIAREARMQVPVVVRTIKTDPELSRLVKVYPRKTQSGLVLITTRDKFSKRASFKDKFIDLFATSRPELDDAK